MNSDTRSSTRLQRRIRWALGMEAVALMTFLIASLIRGDRSALYATVSRFVVMFLLGFFVVRQKRPAMWTFCVFEGISGLGCLVGVLIGYQTLSVFHVLVGLVAVVYFEIAAALSAPVSLSHHGG
jgi:hypothetical protein